MTLVARGWEAIQASNEGFFATRKGGHTAVRVGRDQSRPAQSGQNLKIVLVNPTLQRLRVLLSAGRSPFDFRFLLTSS
jgi:hypothetical protein